MKEQNEIIRWPHIGKLIEKELEHSGMTKAEFGRRLGTSRQNVNSLLRKEFLYVDTIARVSLILGVDFFAPYSQLIAKPSRLDQGINGADLESLRLMAVMQEALAKLNQRIIQ